MERNWYVVLKVFLINENYNKCGNINLYFGSRSLHIQTWHIVYSSFQKCIKHSQIEVSRLFFCYSLVFGSIHLPIKLEHFRCPWINAFPQHHKATALFHLDDAASGSSAVLVENDEMINLVPSNHWTFFQLFACPSEAQNKLKIRPLGFSLSKDFCFIPLS